MRHFKLIAALSLILFCILISFNNCSRVDSRVASADGGSIGLGSTSISVSSPNPYSIPADVQIFAIQGVCNSGVYSLNEVFWVIESNGQVILDSFSAGSGASFVSRCLPDGTFIVNALVPCPGLINTGNGCYGLRQNYTLRVIIRGLNANGFPASGSDSVSQYITLYSI